MSLQWRLTIITTLFIAIICGCLTLFLLQEWCLLHRFPAGCGGSARRRDNGRGTDELYIRIPDDTWNDFANDFSIQVYNNKGRLQKKKSCILGTSGDSRRCCYYFISGRAPGRSVSFQIELKRCRHRTWQIQG